MKPINPLWYLAAFFTAVVGTMVGAAVAAGAWDPVREATLESATHSVDATGRSVAVFTDILQPDRKISCRAAGPGDRVTEIPKAALAITVNSQGDQWHLIGLLTDGTAGLRISCTPKDRRSDDANYDYAIVDGFKSKANTGKGIAILSVTVGVGLAGYTYYARRQRRIYETLDATPDET